MPQKVQEMINRLEEETKHHERFKVNFAMAYGGREEIIDGIKRLIKEGKKDVDENTFSQYLYLQNEPDLIIRTGGEKRTSNFLVWQSWYSEWFFVDKYWSEFKKEDLTKILEEFSQRQRSVWEIDILSTPAYKSLNNGILRFFLMSKIVLLTEDLINKIAAGEVIERTGFSCQRAY